jgi:hypothetical protein
MSLLAPIAQVIAAVGVFHFNNIGTEIRKHMAQHIASNQSGEVKNTNIGKRSLSIRLKRP